VPAEKKIAGKNAPGLMYNMAPSAAPGRMALGMVEGDQLQPPGYYRDTGRDTFAEIKANPLKLVSEEPVSTFSIDVDTSSYAFVRRQLMNGILPQKDAVRVEEMINYFDYDYPVPTDRTKPFKPSVAVYPTPWNPNTMLLHIGIKGYDIVPADKPRSNLVFLLDVSGSMNSPDKLPLLKNSFAMLVDTLDPDDTVAIMVYAGAAGTVLEPTRVREKGKILAALKNLNAGGSTAGGEGIRLAYSLAEMNYDKDAVNRVILATDGDFNVGITSQGELQSYIERKRKTGIFLSVLGFGQGNYNDALMQTLAQNGNGNAAYIDNLNEARKVLVDEAGSTLFTIARDVKIQIEFNPARVHDYRLIGYETRLLKREDFNNDRVDAGDIGSGHSVTAIYEITPVESRKKLINDLRYRKADQKPGPDAGNEYAFLKIRYKLPDQDASTLITTPVTTEQEVETLAKVSPDMRFAAAVAAFGQVLRGDPYTNNFDYDAILKLAGPARGEDRFGYRAEFMNLVRLARTARAM
jgi:Ca-activated chloride channel family protein